MYSDLRIGIPSGPFLQAFEPKHVLATSSFFFLSP
jgi:hypothetical protein